MFKGLEGRGHRDGGRSGDKDKGKEGEDDDNVTNSYVAHKT